MTSVSGALNVISERCAVANTNSISVTDRNTKITGHLTVESTGQTRSEGSAWQGCTSLRGFDPEAIGEKAAEFAIGSLNQKKVKPGLSDVILEPSAVAELLYHVLGYAVNGREIYDRVSYFTDRLGQVVAAEGLNISDYGNMPDGLCSKTFDDEGMPTRWIPGCILTSIKCCRLSNILKM